MAMAVAVTVTMTMAANVATVAGNKDGVWVKSQVLMICVLNIVNYLNNIN